MSSSDSLSPERSPRGADETGEDPEAGRGPGDAVTAASERRLLARVWLGTASALGAMVGATWIATVRRGGVPVGGDMLGHAAAAEWLRTLPWWDWRGWSDWFYGGQAIGVNYPPLGHMWMRFTDPVHGQLAAVAVGLMVLVPWGTLRLARAVGFGARAQAGAVAATAVLAAASAQMHWMLSGFHFQNTNFGSWPTMVSLSCGLFVAAWAARGRSPLAAGAVLGAAVLFNPTVVPGIVVVSAVLLATSGATFRRGLWWAATSGAAALAVCAWWLAPFVAGRARLVRWEARLWDSWEFGSLWQVVVMASVAAAAALAARQDHGEGGARRLALAAGAALVAAAVADVSGYLRAERWLEMPLLVAVAAAGHLVSGLGQRAQQPAVRRAVRPAWAVVAAAVVIVLVAVTGRLELAPIAVWVLGRPQSVAGWGTGAAWAFVLMTVPVFGLAFGTAADGSRGAAATATAAEHAGPGGHGLAHAEHFTVNRRGNTAPCVAPEDWTTTRDTDGAVRPLQGLYRETSASAEFITAASGMRLGVLSSDMAARPDWHGAWVDAGRPDLDGRAAAAALGARWHISCDAGAGRQVTELSPVTASGVAVEAHASDDQWHRAAVQWWMSVLSEPDSPAAATAPADIDKPHSAAAAPVPADIDEPHGAAAATAPADIHEPDRAATAAPDIDKPHSAAAAPVPADIDETHSAATAPVPVAGAPDPSYPTGQRAGGVRLRSSSDTLEVHAGEAGWAWLRVPWDPWWQSSRGGPVLKGGPGHLVVWADEGATTLRWSVPPQVDAAAAALTGTALAAAAALALAGRRRAPDPPSGRRRPAAEAVEVFASTVDAWVRSTIRLTSRRRRKPPHTES